LNYIFISHRKSPTALAVFKIRLNFQVLLFDYTLEGAYHPFSFIPSQYSMFSLLKVEEKSHFAIIG